MIRFFALYLFLFSNTYSQEPLEIEDNEILERVEVIDESHTDSKSYADSEVGKIAKECQKKFKDSSEVGYDIDKAWNCTKEEAKAKGLTKSLGEDLNPNETENINLLSSAHGKRLQQYLIKKLEENLYAESKNGQGQKQKNQVGALHFYRLMESHVGKSIVRTLSEYCFDADETGIIKEDKVKENQEKNLKRLNQFVGDQQNLAFINFANCIGNLKYVCHGCKKIDLSGDISQAAKDPKQKEEVEADCNVGLYGQDGATDAYSKSRACMAFDQVRKIKKELEAITEIRKVAEEKEEVDAKSGFALSGNSPFKGDYDGGKSSKESDSIDGLTTLTSGEYASNLEKGLEDDLETLEKKCASGDSKSCEDIYDKDAKKSLEEVETEQMAKASLMAAKIEEMDEKELTSYLEAQGKTTEEAEKVLSKLKTDGLTEAQIKEQIAKEYMAEQKAIIEGIRQQAKSTRIGITDDKLEKIENNKEVQESYKLKAEQEKQAIHFHNIVSGFFEAEDKTTNKRIRNSASFARELQDAGFSEDTKNDPSTYSAEDIESLSQSLESKGYDTKSVDVDGEGINLSLEGDEIEDQILNE